MIRRIAAMIAFIALAIAIGAHLSGDEGLAETCGTIAFLTLFAATIVPPLRGEREADA